ncbi:MAG: YARHG domain-containing protein [Ignavibacteria bacterium]|nr:YARHG domain-containing protein [Ignavibacteria bacterium]
MKKLIYLLVIVLVFVFTSCNKSDDTKTVRPKKERQFTEQETTNKESSREDENLSSKESELKQKELELKEKELQLEEEKMKMEREKNITPPPPKQNRKRYGSVPGNYPEASTRYLSYSDIAGLSKWQLSVMRNEIYARHGYIFTQNMSIKNHFERQPWYVPTYYNVERFLTKVEKSNINFIKRYE